MAAAIRSIIRKVASRKSMMNNFTTFETRNLIKISHNLTLFPVVHLPQMQWLPRKSEHDKLLEQLPKKLYIRAGPVMECSTDYPAVGIEPHFALEELNKQKNSQLQLSRVVKAYNQVCGGFNHVLLTLEAVDADLPSNSEVILGSKRSNGARIVWSCC